MKKTRSSRPLATLALSLTGLALLATSSFALEALPPCKQACLDQHQGTVEALLQTHPAPGENDALARRETVLKAIDALNNCVKACDLAPAPAPEPAPAPRPSKRK
jgi:hypothetical protein